MKSEDIFTNIKLIEMYPPATDLQIDKSQKDLDVIFPKQYIEFLKMTNGLNGENFYFEPVQDLPKMNEIYQIKRRLPDWLRIGTDGGGYSILFNLKDSGSAPYLCEDGAMFEDIVIKQSDNLFEWLIKGVPLSYESQGQGELPELIQRKNEIKFKALVKEAKESFKKKDFKKTIELFNQAQTFQEIDDKLDLKYLEISKKYEQKN